jgi:hypothetical protein
VTRREAIASLYHWWSLHHGTDSARCTLERLRLTREAVEETIHYELRYQYQEPPDETPAERRWPRMSSPERVETLMGIYFSAHPKSAGPVSDAEDLALEYASMLATSQTSYLDAITLFRAKFGI